MTRKLLIILSLMMGLIFSMQIRAEASAISVVSAGDGLFTIQGSSMDGIAGIDITINYDPATITNARVNQGGLISGAMMLANVNVPGSIRIAVITTTPFRGSGPIASVAYDRKGTSAGRITAVNAKVANLEGKYLPVTTGFVNPTDSSNQQQTPPDNTSSTGTITTPATTETSSVSTPTGSSTSTTTTSTSSTSQSTWLGGVSVTTDQGVETERKPEPRQSEIPADNRSAERAYDSPSATSDQGQQPSAPKDEKEKKATYFAYPSLLDRFRDFQGERTLKNLSAIYEVQQKGFSQEPSLFLADGKATLKAIITVPPTASAAPNFALNKDAQMVSFQRGSESDSTWIVEVRPKKGAYNVVLSYFLDDVMTEIPLIVAPRLESYRSKSFSKLTEADAIQFLEAAVAGKDNLANDLNSDKLVNYIDDYIFLSNYLVQTPPKPAAKQETDKKAPVAEKTKPEAVKGDKQTR